MPMTTTLQECVLGVHFRSVLNMSVVDLADFVAEFNDEFPEMQQLPVLPHVEPIPELQSFNAVVLPGFVLPRVILRAVTGGMSLQLQQDRLVLGWTRSVPVGEPADYPGYEMMKTRWAAAFDKFTRWHEQKIGGTPDIRVVELGYNNADPVSVDGRARRLSEMFRFVQPSSRQLISFQALWSELVQDVEPFALVTAQATIGTAAPDQVVFVYNFTGLGMVRENAGVVEAVAHLDALHVRILDMREAAIISTSR